MAVGLADADIVELMAWDAARVRWRVGPFDHGIVRVSGGREGFEDLATMNDLRFRDRGGSVDDDLEGSGLIRCDPDLTADRRLIQSGIRHDAGTARRVATSITDGIEDGGAVKLLGLHRGQAVEAHHRLARQAAVIVRLAEKPEPVSVSQRLSNRTLLARATCGDQPVRIRFMIFVGTSSVEDLRGANPRLIRDIGPSVRVTDRVHRHDHGAAGGHDRGERLIVGG